MSLLYVQYFILCACSQQLDKAQGAHLESIDWSKRTWHPSTFHDDYCVPQVDIIHKNSSYFKYVIVPKSKPGLILYFDGQSIQWAKDDGQDGDNVSDT